MNDFYKWFNRTLILLFIIIPLISYVPLIYLTGNNIVAANFWNNVLNPIFRIFFFGNYLFGGLYIVTGIVLVIINVIHKKKNISLSIRMWITGIIMIIMPYLVFSLCIFSGFCGLALPNYSMPKIPTDPDNNYHSFPVQNLKIINIQAIQPTTPGDTWGCDITVQNSNSSLGAMNISFGLAYSTYLSKSDDTILPGKTRVIRIASYSTGIKNPCSTKASVQSAGIVKK